MVRKQEGTVEDAITEDATNIATRKPRAVSIPFTFNDAEAYADMAAKVTGEVVGVQQDGNGQWAVVVETTITKTKRLCTLNAVLKYIAATRKTWDLAGTDKTDDTE